MKDREAARSAIRKALAPYAGGRFETGGSGGASGMMFFVDREGRRYFIGGLNAAHAAPVTEALNATLFLLDGRD